MSRVRKKVFWCLIGFLSLTLPIARAGNFTNFTMVRSFLTSDLSTGPGASVTEASDGLLYGTTFGNGSTDLGGVFKVGRDGSNFQVIHQFSTAEGDEPEAPVIEATNGMLYGTTLSDGTNFGGAIFEMDKNGSNVAVLHAFTFAANDGGYSTAPLLQASDGELYGTTQEGGNDGGSDGVVYRIDPSGSNFVVMHAFVASSDGVSPEAGLIEGTNGMLYGTTSSAGPSNGGTVFAMSKDGTVFDIIFSFTNAANASNGFTLESSLLSGPNGLLYGTTTSGGTNNEGVAFSMDYNGSNFTVLHNFGGANDGSDAQALIEGPDGGLYGNTQFGGGTRGEGTVFTINPDGSGYKVLLVATNAIGSQVVGLISGTDGALYGTCAGGGTDNAGTIFKLTGSAVIDNDILNSPTNLGGTGWLISGHGTANRTYTVLASTNVALAMSNWTSLGTATADGSGNWQLNDLTNTPTRFYRTSYP